MPSFHETTLSSGLRIAAEIDTRGYSAALGYFVRAGARDEADPESGLSHFLEHMMFKGTASRTAADVNRELDELGGNSNAYTSEEQTVYYAAVLPKFQHRLVDLLTDMLSPKLDEDEFETERQVILEEIAKYEDQPPFGAFERAFELHFGPRGLGRRVLGTRQSITAMTADAMRAYFNRRYQPENIVLAATGNVDFDALVAQVESLTQSWSARSDLASDHAVGANDGPGLPDGISLDADLGVAAARQDYRVGIGSGPSIQDDDRHAARMLAAIVGDEGGSRLFWELIDTGRAEVATVWPQEFSDTGVWMSYLVGAPEDAESNQSLIEDCYRRVATDGVTEDELGQAVNKATAELIMQSERPGNRLFGLGTRWLLKREYHSLDQSLDKLRALTAGSIRAAAQRYLDAPSHVVRAGG